MKRSDIKRRPLSDTVIASLEPEAQTYRVLDSPGLYLRVTPAGTKDWQFRYRKPDGKWSWHGLGGYPAVKGAQARLLAAQRKVDISQGSDPVAEARARREPAGDDPRLFSSAAAFWYERKVEAGRADETLAQMRRYLNGDILPLLGTKALGDVTRADCAAVQARLEDRGAHDIAAKVRVWIRQIFSQAIARGLCDLNPASELLAIAKPAPPVQHYPHLLEAELPEFLRALQAGPATPISKTAAWLCLWTASRPGMVRWAEWSEIDLEQALWIVPAAKMKGRIDHLVPLSRQAVVALTELQRITGRGRYVFAGKGSTNPVISENTISKVFASVGYKGRLTGHGSRHTASTLLREHGWPKDHVEAQLAHKEQGVAGVYNKAKYLQQRREMMQWYADYLATLGGQN